MMRHLPQGGKSGAGHIAHSNELYRRHDFNNIVCFIACGRWKPSTRPRLAEHEIGQLGLRPTQLVLYTARKSLLKGRRISLELKTLRGGLLENGAPQEMLLTVLRQLVSLQRVSLMSLNNKRINTYGIRNYTRLNTIEALK